MGWARGDGGKLQRQGEPARTRGVQVQGGYIEIFGQVFNTNRTAGAGRLRVPDGYGQIGVDNRSGLAMVVNVLDAGRGVKGEINISDIVGIAADGTRWWPRPASPATRAMRAPASITIRPAACATASPRAPAR